MTLVLPDDVPGHLVRDLLDQLGVVTPFFSRLRPVGTVAWTLGGQVPRDSAVVAPEKRFTDASSRVRNPWTTNLGTEPTCHSTTSVPTVSGHG